MVLNGVLTRIMTRMGRSAQSGISTTGLAVLGLAARWFSERLARSASGRRLFRTLVADINGDRIPDVVVTVGSTTPIYLEAKV